MRSLGKVINITRGGDIILRGGEIPALFSQVGTKTSKIGKVKDIIGPVSNPYIVVKPIKNFTEEELQSLKNETLYEYRRKRSGKKSRVH